MKIITGIMLGSCIVSLLFTVGVAAQSAAADLAGARFVSSTNPVADTNARFTLGLRLEGETSYRTTARLSDRVSITGTIRPETAHIGMTADIFVVDRVNLAFMMKDQNGVFRDWNGRVPDLVPFREDVVLSDNFAVDVYTGLLGASGDHRIFIGYMPAGGTLYYTPAPHRLDITTKSASEQAFSMFTTTISPDIITTRCIQCHVNGGLAQAGGAYHIFSAPPVSFLTTNFAIFQGLVARRPVAYILDKVTGGNSHGGGVQLVAGSVDYQNLQAFLDLVAQDVPDVPVEIPDYEYPY